MSYRIVFSDRTQLTVDDDQGHKLMETQASTRKPDYVNIQDSQYRLSSITKVIKVPNEPKPAQLITSGKVGHEKSIHAQIVSDWSKELEKPAHRNWEDFRQAGYEYYYSDAYSKKVLNGATPEWCDDRKGTCVCSDKKEPAMPPSTGDKKAIMEYMRS